MRIFDRIDPEALERRHWQLSMLALGMILILAVGMALLMYPAVFAHRAAATAPPSRTLYFSFCGLCVLLVAYLLNRQYVVRQLRAKVVEEKRQIASLRESASADLLGTLLGFSHFQDRLTMGFRRAAQISEPLSLVLVRLKLAPMFANTPEGLVALGDAARVLTTKLRGEDSLYRLSSHVFGIVLPNTSSTHVKGIADRVAEGLTDAAGVSNRFSFEKRVVNYPDEVTTAYEMEQIAGTFSAQKA